MNAIASRPAIVAAFATVVLAAGSAAAQNPPPPGAPPVEGPLVARYVAAQKVGRCVARRNPKVATRFVLSSGEDRTNAASPEAAFRYAAVPCLAGEFRSVRLNSVEARGAVAEALLKEHDAALLQRARTVAPRPPARVAPPVGGAPNFALFDCAVAASPGQAAALLEQAPGTPGEAAAFAAIGPALQACAPLDTALRVKPSNVRWLDATALFRLVAQA